MSPKARGGQAQSRGTPLSGCWLNHTAPGAALQLVCVRSCTPWNQHADEQQVHWQDNKQCHETWCTLLEPAQPHQLVALKDTLSRNHSTCFSSGFSACPPLPGTGQPLQGRLSDCKRWTAWDKLTAKICSKKTQMQICSFDSANCKRKSHGCTSSSHSFNSQLHKSYSSSRAENIIHLQDSTSALRGPCIVSPSDQGNGEKPNSIRH